MVKLAHRNPYPVVSVCMITYNHEEYISEAIESVLMQKCDFPIELVIGEDFSSDSTRKICLQYKIKHPDIIRLLIPDSNLGMIKNWTATFHACKGKYIALCEGDDYWTDPYKLQKQYLLLENSPDCSMCVAKTKVIENGQLKQIFGEGNQDKYGLLDILNKVYFHTSTYFAKKELLKKYFSDECTLPKSDTSMLYFLSDLGSIILLNEIVSVFRLTGNGVFSSLNVAARLRSHIAMHEAFFRNFNIKYRNTFSSVLIDEHFELLLISIKKLLVKDLLKSFVGLLIGLFRNPMYFLTTIGQRMRLLAKIVEHKLKCGRLDSI